MILKQENELLFIKYLRGICAFMILFCHINGAFFHSNDSWANAINTPVLSDVSWPKLFVKLKLVDYGLQLGFFAVFSVMMFFFLSSFCTCISFETKTCKEFWRTRLIKLFPFYAIVLIFDMILVFVNCLIYSRPFPHNFKTILMQLGMSVQNTVFNYPDILQVTWFLGVLILFYLVSSLSYYLYHFITKKQFSLISILFSDVLVCLLLIINKFFNIPYLNKDGIEKSLSLILFMYVAQIFYLHFKNRISAAQLFLWILFQAILSATFYRKFGAHYITANEFWAYQIIVVTIFWLAYLYSAKMTKNKILSFFGENSYALYIVHGYLGFTVLSFLIIKAHLNKSLSCIISFIVVIYTSFIFHKYIEKPVTKFLLKRTQPSIKKL